ncbi:xylulokinase [Xylanimonas cellulosilytica DSM 15894]|uniref:Xylulose kinase n=1 Tax=Xylanimonas cellulosilytica (strain DSM 15894 / JCM 12276 / CECT 5975 / KCTC 9989 / LMG 20990 / NBRC 107835 / XIL07) TaxID=446471 RepID=D1BYH0_XYLCX|nr:FGGY family carbohydrate kinase [Xylanimonas cellulosilytica]ACZ31842.1 xylulokinase [Xylanimonas cellulosilytica DSM 15894]
MPLVAGVDSSTQSCKIVVRDAVTGELVRSGSAKHPDGTSVDPTFWWTAFAEAAAKAGGLADVAALSVGGQQHGMVALDAEGNVVRDALLWNDTRSAQAAEDLIAELGDGDRTTGAQAWADAVGSVLVASLTITKLRWLRDAEPENAAKVAAVALPHDWLSWRIAGYGPQGDPTAPLGPQLDKLFTDASDASGTGYYDAQSGQYRRDLLKLAFGRDDLILPRVVGATESGAVVHASVAGDGTALIGPGAGDNAGAAIGLGMQPGDIAISIGTSGVVSAVAPQRTQDGTGAINGFADCTGNALMLAVTLNAAQVLDAARSVLDADFGKLADLALSAPAGSDGLVLVPYLQGERTPNRPDASGTLHGIRLKNMTQAHVARAYIEGMLCGLADGMDALRALDVPVERVMLIGGAAQSPAVQEIAPQIFGLPISIPEPGEYVADGAARQAAWVLASAEADAPVDAPAWSTTMAKTLPANPVPVVREQYAAVRDLV